MSNITFGLTGGICCGKSLITKTFRAHNIPIVDADIVARQVVEPGTYGLHELVVLFGKEILQSDGTLNRAKLGDLFFANKHVQDQLNGLMGPLIEEEGDIQIAELHKQGHNIVGWDAALIIESGRAKQFKPLIVVHCPLEQQIVRLMKRGSFTREEAIIRINMQLPSLEKASYANIIISTAGTIEETEAKTKLIIKELLDAERTFRP